MIDPVDRRESALLAVAHSYGVTVHRADLLPGERGRFEASQSRILISRGLTVGQEVATLAHEVVHARRGDDGHQEAAVERFVDEEAARLIITAAAYRDAEQVEGPDLWGIARHLDVTPGLVLAWQRAARRLPAILAS
ncbi:MAG: hypothetical protein Q4C85_08445 [Actinomyces sp.]|uniref:IrrE N-terminal-like domain-containing protein n=1 Tax=Actinomyces howellii TaxID=52771 RepID=A0A3S4RFF8_9ACTO|nr:MULTISPECIES: DUF6782 family putative metallopeptidase [Actinomyces]MDO4243766.1 hypothetical protein [Actinomyces sp.]VEG28005.1 Uncharacterised protein [Actinomyces howellii]